MGVQLEPMTDAMRGAILDKTAAAFNEWMRRYTVDPAAFSAEFQTVGLFLAEQAQGKEPTYGDTCAAYLAALIAEAA